MGHPYRVNQGMHYVLRAEGNGGDSQSLSVRQHALAR